MNPFHVYTHTHAHHSSNITQTMETSITLQIISSEIYQQLHNNKTVGCRSYTLPQTRSAETRILCGWFRHKMRDVARDELEIFSHLQFRGRVQPHTHTYTHTSCSMLYYIPAATSTQACGRRIRHTLTPVLVLVHRSACILCIHQSNVRNRALCLLVVMRSLLAGSERVRKERPSLLYRQSSLRGPVFGGE